MSRLELGVEIGMLGNREFKATYCIWRDEKYYVHKTHSTFFLIPDNLVRYYLKKEIDKFHCSELPDSHEIIIDEQMLTHCLTVRLKK